MFQLKNPIWWRRFLVMIFGVYIMGMGVVLFKFSLMGNDPHSAMVMAIGNYINLSFSSMLIIINSIWFILDNFLTTPDNMISRFILMFTGVIILSFSAALYQTANLGIAPYDAISLIMDEHLPLPYFWCRIITDSTCAVVAFFFGGIIGLGTLFCALGLGPFINYFTHTAARKLCGYEKAVTVP